MNFNFNNLTLLEPILWLLELLPEPHELQGAIFIYPLSLFTHPLCRLASQLPPQLC